MLNVADAGFATPPAFQSSEGTIPLVIDVDGTLARTDLLYESALKFIARYPMQFWRLLVWLLQGKGVLKSKLAPHLLSEMS